MDFSLGFLVVLILVIFPGLIYRRLYFYNEFSKEFKSKHNLISLIAISAIPGIINLICVFIFYDYYFNHIDLGGIIDKFKDINNVEFKFKNSNDTPLKDLLTSKVAPFIGFLYLTIFLLGSISGRFVRISRIDTKFKLLRFKNYWFYLFNGQHTGFKKMKHLKLTNKKHLFTNVDILIDLNNEDKLYSGMIVDYELLENECNTLNKVILQDAKRYSLKNEEKVSVEIPGDLLVVDCSTMKNINFTYIYEETKSILESKIPSYTEIIFSLIILAMLPIFIFKSNSVDFYLYVKYFDLNWFVKIIAFLLSTQIISLFNPFRKEDGEYKFVNLRYLIVKTLWIIALLIIMWILI